MPTLYSKRLLAANMVAATPYSANVPGDKIWVIRDISVGAGGTGLEFVAQGGGISFVQLYLTLASGVAVGTLRWEGRQVLNPGDTLEMFSNGSCAAAISGYELNSP